jgi:hypothetical protein
VLSSRTYANPLNLDPRKLLNKLHILPRLNRQIIVALRTRRGFLPARERLVLHLELSQGLRVCGERFELLAVVRIRRCDLDLFEVVEHVELGQVEGGVVVDGVRVLYHDEIEPAAAAFAARGYADFVADLLQLLAYFVQLLCWEGTTASC